jgi:spermidine/putrescine transport system substrate-binding protein
MARVRCALFGLALLTMSAGAAPPAGADPEKTLVLGIWSNYMPAETLKVFEKEQGCRVEVPWNYSSNDELLSKLQTKASGFDLVVPSDLILKMLADQDLLEKLDLTKLPNIKHLDPYFRRRTADLKEEWAVPYTWGTVGIAWRADKVKGDIDSWSVFGTDRGGGNTYLLDEARDAIGAALLFHGKSVNSVVPKDLAEAKVTLLEWKAHLKGYTGEVKDHLLSGEAWIIQAYNGDVAQAMRESPGKFKFAVPKEGGIRWVDNLVIPKGAPHKDLAYKFIDYILRPEVAADLSSRIRYAVPNRTAITDEKLDMEIRKDPVIYPPQEVRQLLFQEEDIGKDLKLYTDLWSEVRAGG